MKKLTAFTALLLALTLACAGALAATANATVVAPKTVKVTAPFAGTLLPFDLTAGQEVAAGEVLFELDTVPVYATQAGKVGAVFADLGDDASGVQSRYGALAVIEPTNMYYIEADTSQAYDSDDNKKLHTGETLYLKCNNDKGTGIVTSVSDKYYTVEILTGDFNPGNTVRCFRESSMPNDSETGRGKVKRYEDARVVADGRVVRINVKPGDTVAVGDVLFEVISAQSDRNASPILAAPVSGAVTGLYVASGAQVYRGALLCEIADLSALELSVEVDELDIGRIKVGSVLSFTLDAYAGQTFSGAVTEIRPIGSPRQNATYFDVRVAAPQGVSLLPGMNATFTIGQ